MKMKQTLLKVAFTMLFSVLPIMAFSQGTISGNVTDTNNVPLPGVTVVEKGTSNGTTTDFDGNYSITVGSFPGTLQFSSLGFASKEAKVTGPTTLDVFLDEAATGLDEVVVTGLATSVKRSNSANAVATVSAAQLAEVTPPQTLDGAYPEK